MAKAKLVNRMNLYHSTAGVPDAIPFLDDLPCRFVPQRHMFPEGLPLGARVAWVTYTAAVIPSPSQEVVGMDLHTHFGNATWVEIATMPGLGFIVLGVEHVADVMPVAYYRASVGFPFWIIGEAAAPLWLGNPSWDDNGVPPEWRGFLGDALS